MKEYTNKQLERFLERAEELDWSYNLCKEYDGRTYVEMETYSHLGEDFSMIIDYSEENPIDTFMNDLKEYYSRFDPEEHAEMWIVNRGENGIPDSIQDLIDDAKDIESMINDLIKYLEGNTAGETITEAMDGMRITNEYDYRIGFINADGQEDETELSADSNEDLVNTYETFCEDNGFPKDTVTYIELVGRTYMEMNVGYLKDVIKDLPDDMPVFVACQGECNYDFDRKQPCRETNTFGIVHDGKLFITDDCAVETGNGTL